MTDEYQFSERAIVKIAAAVRDFENRLRGQIPPPVSYSPPRGLRLAKITDGADGKYSWTALEPQEDGTLQPNADWGSGDHAEESGFARELLYNSEHVLNGAVVEMFPSYNQEFYYFRYNPGTIRAKTSTIIPKRSGQTLGQGEATVEHYEDDGTLTAGQQITVYSSYKSDVNPDAVADQIIRLSWAEGGIWEVEGEDCSEDESP